MLIRRFGRVGTSPALSTKKSESPDDHEAFLAFSRSRALVPMQVRIPQSHFPSTTRLPWSWHQVTAGPTYLCVYFVHTYYMHMYEVRATNANRERRVTSDRGEPARRGIAGACLGSLLCVLPRQAPLRLRSAMPCSRRAIPQSFAAFAEPAIEVGAATLLSLRAGRQNSPSPPAHTIAVGCPVLDT